MSAALDATEAFVEPGAYHIIDMVNPHTGVSHYAGENLEQIRLRYPAAERVDFAQWLDAKAKAQDSVEAQWLETTEERYWEMLEVLPPEEMAGGAFLVGEPVDHHVASGKPRFACYRKGKGGDFLVLNKPITRAAFREMLARDSAYHANS